VTFESYGPDALLIRLGSNPSRELSARIRALTASLTSHPVAGLTECVPGPTTVLLEFDFPSSAPVNMDRAEAALRELIDGLDLDAVPAPRVIELPVVYEGEDLARLAKLKHVTTAEIIEMHAAPTYWVETLGFTPGFAYLGGLDPRLHTPRLGTPRPRVRAGSVGIGGSHTGVYPLDGPGGWNLIGWTPSRVFDAEQARNPEHRDRMCLFHPGDQVRFVPVPRA
jgi:KipI family sensor histidine kinase inhibitor